MGRILLEVCCGSADDVIEAHRGGADRVELFDCRRCAAYVPIPTVLASLHHTDICV